jgi:hypothetical protein
MQGGRESACPLGIQMPSKKIHPPINEKLLLDQIVKCKTPMQVMKLFGYGPTALDADYDWGYVDRRHSWTAISADLQMRCTTTSDDSGKRHPMFEVSHHVPDGATYLLFKASCNLPNFNFPLDKKQQCQWVLATFDQADTRFQNELMIGSFTDCVKLLGNIDRRKMAACYAALVINLHPGDLSKLRSKLQDHMLDEIEEADQQHAINVGNIRNRYRNQLNYFTALFDEAQAAIDAKQKAQYAFQLDGYPPSKLYSTYKEARRSHSRRNVPNVECVIHRTTKKQDHKFARWSVADKVWVIL